LELSPRIWLGSGAVFALALLTRPEGILLFGLFWTTLIGLQLVAHLRPRPFGSPFASLAARRLLILNGLIVTSVLVVHLTARYFIYDGEWLLNTYYAKLSGFLHEQVATYIAQGILPADGWPGRASGSDPQRHPSTALRVTGTVFRVMRHCRNHLDVIPGLTRNPGPYAKTGYRLSPV